MRGLVVDAKSLLVIDDLFNTGNTIEAMIRKLRPQMKYEPTVTVACTLYVPLEPKEEQITLADLPAP